MPVKVLIEIAQKGPESFPDKRAKGPCLREKIEYAKELLEVPKARKQGIAFLKRVLRCAKEKNKLEIVNMIEAILSKEGALE